MNILLLEPTYTAKFPPLGLMKISSYYKHCRGDFVWFSKGQPPAQVSDAVRAKLQKSKYYSSRYDIDLLTAQANAVLQQGNWDRVCITTLFTYEWQKTIDMIEYAKTFVPPERIFVGGVLATLMPDELEKATGIKPMTGLLRSSNDLGFDDDIDVDMLTPDYSILDNTEYTYEIHDAYFMSATKGCGMRCSFCAVQRLEPEYECYRSLLGQKAEIDELYGPRKNLMLQDNNILLSKCFDQIIDEIIAMGFGRGATFINPQTGKPNKRELDFNSGLDANLMTPHKAAQLARTAITPARIAFDHIDDQGKYLKAATIAEQAGHDKISNYLLYNTPDFSGKGKPRRADLPEDLYNRMRINIDFAEKANQRRTQEGLPPLAVYSYPMSYLPLDGKDRSYRGVNWCSKTHQAVRKILAFTRGVAYARRPFFEAVYGETVEIFLARLWMPTHYIEHGLASKAAQSSEKTRQKNLVRNEAWHDALDEWMRCYKLLNESERSLFHELAKDATFTLEKYCALEQDNLRRLYLHYFPSTQLVVFLEQLREKNASLYPEAIKYLQSEGGAIIKANIFLLSKLKSGEELTAKLRRMVCVHVVQKSYQPRRKVYADTFAA